MTETPLNPAPPANAPSAQTTILQAQYNLTKQLRGGADWFFWIAALSLINTIIFISGGSTNFVIGLGATQVIDAIMEGFLEGVASDNGVMLVRVINIVLDVGLLGVFVLFGFFARKGHRWAFIIGMILYFLDTLLSFIVFDWLSIAFHALALWGLFSGFQAIGKLKKVNELLTPPSAITPV